MTKGQKLYGVLPISFDIYMFFLRQAFGNEWNFMGFHLWMIWAGELMVNSQFT